jgi:hypothetical protein
MAVSVRASGGVFEAAKAAPFLENQVFLAHSGPGGSKQQYSITREGKILVNHSVESVQTPINLILNWQSK